MEKKKIIDDLLKLMLAETKRMKKKKKKHPLVATPVLRRPMGSIFYMDAGVSMAESLNESAGKPITKKFNHLKWQLNDFQKQFLDDFINIPDSSLKEDDYLYASKRTGIPVASIKSIRNTYADLKTPEQIAAEALRVQRELGLGGPSTEANEIEKNAKGQIADARDLPKEKSGMQWSMNPNPEFRNKSLHQMKYEDELAAEVGGGLTRKSERELPKFMYEWLLYFIEGSEQFKITESKLMNDFHSDKFEKCKFVLFSFDTLIKESGAHPYDIGSNTRVKEIQELENKLVEFNNIFGTNFVVVNQYTGDDGFLKVVLENAQTTDGQRIYNRKFIDMSDNDIKKAIGLGFYDQFTTTRKITVDDPVTVARNIIGQ